MDDALAEVLQEVLWSVEQVVQQLPISLNFSRVVPVYYCWLKVCIERFVPGPPFGTIRKES